MPILSIFTFFSPALTFLIFYFLLDRVTESRVSILMEAMDKTIRDAVSHAAARVGLPGIDHVH